MTHTVLLTVTMRANLNSPLSDAIREAVIYALENSVVVTLLSGDQQHVFDPTVMLADLRAYNERAEGHPGEGEIV